MPRCADVSCGRWRPEVLAPRWASGIRFNGRWYCSRTCVEHAARAGLDTPAVPAAPAVALPPLKLGVLLRHLGVISEADLNRALESQRQTGLRLGAELQRLGLVPAEPIVRALAAQGGVSYLPAFDIGRVTRGPAWLPADTVRALGVVPFEVDEARKTLRVVCSAPVPRTAMRALLKLTGWSAEAYLIEDELLQQSLRAYRPVHATAQIGEAITVAGVAAAAARVADTALAGRALTMKSARCDRYTWVRLEGPSHVSDLLVSRAPERINARRSV
ncbi:MAG: hypothetical protein HY657_06960 [Acidobacteria bacterium]|nr:hypothetical protein [Acidobacteriota bacterium]